MDSYILRPEELPNLERRLSSITLPPPKDDEALDVETFALIRATPEILHRSSNTLYARLERGDDFRIHTIFFDKKRAFTYFILHYLGFFTTSDYVNELKKNIERAETSLTRFLSLYAPGPLSDTEGRNRGTIDVAHIHQGLSALFSPAGFFGTINVDSQHHTITYGHQPANATQEAGKAYLDEMVKAILDIRSTYGKLTKILIFLTELSGYHVDINQEVQRKYHGVRTQIGVVNSLLRELASSPDVFKTDEGIKKFVALHNALHYLNKDTRPLHEGKHWLRADEAHWRHFNSLRHFPSLPFSWSGHNIFVQQPLTTRLSDVPYLSPPQRKLLALETPSEK